MSIYEQSGLSGKLSRHKLRRMMRKSVRQSQATRAVFALSQQWKRYPNSKAIVDLRLGNKTHTDLYPEGYDPFFSVHNPSRLPIKGEKPDILANHPDVDKIILSDVDDLKGVCLSLWSYNKATIERFKYLCRANLPTELQWFHQCNAHTYQMFELWKPNHRLMITAAERIAKALGKPLIINLEKNYYRWIPRGEIGKEVTLPPFEPFDPLMHSFNDFFGQ